MKRKERLIFENEIGTLEFSTSSVFHVNVTRDVKGLSGLKTTRYTNSGMGQDGVTDLGGDADPRDISIVGHIDERSKSIAADHHRRLMRILNAKYPARLIHEAEGVRRVIDCVVEVSPDHEGQPILDSFTIELNCPNPYWREDMDTREDIATWTGGMEFFDDEEDDGLELTDFEIDSEEGWEIGYREPALIVDVYNSGDVEAGLRVDFRATGTLTNPTLLNVKTQAFMRLGVTAAGVLTMHSGDVLTVTTGYGKKTVKLTHDSITTDAMKYWDIDGEFLNLAVGDNLLRSDAESGLEALEVSVYHNNYYSGVA